ncbi:FMN phosphatase YigB (HAD superfamily) [Amnibacterium kyonggiense]|uniref:FMN phosphatase YigB (HAD superfamily) n=1 Tax=Amnibacterium kyonggiense TaxID=595671 RepID=A0A4R7FJB9_9MICO|nr:FMN phosphatase YigB (HAD superfamily) [Amnibacterium kyonggiense]
MVLDLDGTVAVGDDPVLVYFRGVAGGDADEAFARWVETGEGHRDGYALVADWAASHRVAEHVRAAAYAASRAALHSGEAAVAAPAGLADLLRDRPRGVRCVLVTNAPVDGIEPLLERLGVAGLLDAVEGDAGKPAGMPAVLERLLGEAGLPADRLLSVGDVWRNDLEPAAAIGAATAFIDRFDRGEGSPTFRARTLEALMPDVERWWSA